MFTQGSSAQMKIAISLIDDTVNTIILEDATVTVYFKAKEYEFNRECIVTDKALGIAMCYLTADDLKLAGTYNYQVVLKYSNGRVVKSCIDDFLVYPALDMPAPIIATDTTGVDING